MSESILSTFECVPSWQCMTHDDDAQVLAFWDREQAGLQGEAATQRVQQVVLRAVDGTGQLVAVSTVEPRTIPRLQQPMYYYRCFVGAAWRDGGLGVELLRQSFDVLDSWARVHDFPCIGVLVEVENAHLAQQHREAVWPYDLWFSFIGRSPRGLDLRVRYFPGACLKTPG